MVSAETRAAFWGAKARNLDLARRAEDYPALVLRCAHAADQLHRFTLAVKAEPKVYTAIVGDLAGYMADAFGVTAPLAKVAADELADLDKADPKFKAKAKAILDKLQAEMEKAGADFAANPTEAATLSRFLAAATALGRDEVFRPMGWEAGFTLADQDALHGLTNAGLFWIGDAYGARLDQDRLLEIVQDVMVNQGLGRAAAGEALAKAFGAEHARSASYWRGLAATVTTRARSFGALGAMVQAGATIYEYVNPLDERTSDVCRALDGTQFEVKGGVRLKSRLLQATTPEEWREISPWPRPSDLNDADGHPLAPAELQRRGIAWPPLHFHCRSSIDVTVWAPVSELDDFGAVEEEAPKPPPKPRAPRKPREPKPKPQERHAIILAERTGGQAGSNEGGFYRGADGVSRYVKVYADPNQAIGEHIANRIYRDLGLGAPESELFRLADGRLGYASVILDNEGTLANVLPTLSAAAREELAREALQGFAADVLTANWDAAGLSLDNMVRLPGGKVARIDQGGALLFRAQGARKPAAALARDSMPEWWKYLDGTNPGYRRLAEAAKIDQAVEIPQLEEQIREILALRKKSKGWAKYLSKETALPEAERDAIVALLDERCRLLERKAENLETIRRIDFADVGWKRGAKARAWGDSNLIPARKMNAREKAALRDYTGGAYTSINGHLRRGGAPTADDLLRQSSIGRSFMPEDVVVWRGNTGVKPLLAVVEDGAASEGNVQIEPGFRSTSITREACDAFKAGFTEDANILWRILLPKGTPGAWVEDFTQVSNEYEILLGMGSRLRVLSSKLDKSTNTWFVNAVAEPD